MAAPRYAMDYPVVLESPAGRVSGITMNLSQSGLGLKVPESCGLEPGTQVNVLLHFQRPAFPGEEPRSSRCALVARVIWKRGTRCGLEILSSDEEARMFYDSLVDGYKVLLEFQVAA